MMRRVCLIAWVLGTLVCLVSCKEKPVGPGAMLQEALTALDRGDYDTYLHHVDFGTAMDSLQEASLRKVLSQHVESRHAQCAAPTAIDTLDILLHSDTVCTVYYQYTFADSTKEVASQKMVRHGETWKLRLRN